MSNLSVRGSGEVFASKIVRSVRGKTPSCLVEDLSGALYNIRIAGVPANGNYLANEWIGSFLARSVGLSVPEATPIYLSREFLNQHSHLLDLRDALGRTIQPGFQCGIRFLGDLAGHGRAFQHLNSTDLQSVMNKGEFAGIQLFNQWACNVQPRTVFLRSRGTRELRAFFVDNSQLFGGASWESLPADFHPELNTSTSGVKSEEQALLKWTIRLQSKLPVALTSLIPLVPHQWYVGDLAKLHCVLLRRLDSLSVIRAKSSRASKWYLPLSYRLLSRLTL